MSAFDAHCKVVPLSDDVVNKVTSQWYKLTSAAVSQLPAATVTWSGEALDLLVEITQRAREEEVMADSSSCLKKRVQITSTE